MFTRTGAAWTQQAKLVASDQEDTAYFGISVALSASGNAALNGAHNDDGSGAIGSDSGVAYFFSYD